MKQRINNLLVLMIILGSVAGLLFQLGADAGVVRLLFGLLLVFILPGYALVEAFFAKAALGLPERVLLTIGTSLALAALGGVLLNKSALGLENSTWILLFAGVTVIGSLAAWWRYQRQSQPPMAISDTPVRIGFKLPEMVLLGLALLITSVALSMARTPAPTTAQQGYTMLWMVPGQIPDQPSVRLGVTNMEFIDTQYRLVVTAGNSVVAEWPTLDLATKQEWVQNVTLTPQQVGEGNIQATLYRTDKPELAYRQVVMK